MPLYEYQCKKCKHRFERIQSFSDAPIKKCPSCGANAVEKLLSAPAVHFKGSGFYVTDYAKKSSTSEGSSSGDSKGESKAAAKDGASGSSEKAASETKSSDSSASKDKSSSSESKSPSAEPKGDPRGRSSHSRKSKRS